MNSSDAIILRNARKQYGKNAPILNGVNLTVARGSIYGLLGASGCGKTTLLSCVVGVRKLDSGDIWVLGGQPGTKGSGIPGPRVGYMPQDISLIDEFTVLEAFHYFGRINGMEDEAIEERYTFLKDLLQFPANDRYIRDMSGGQQRRVSFGVSLVHNPELLILDEPTVGLDPVLRDNIWNFMSHITKEQGITIIITTHYIEETNKASRIGLLRGGLLLAEASPNRLLERFQTDSLEDAFLSLSKSQEENQARGITDTAFITLSDDTTTNIESAPPINYIEKRINKEPRNIKRKRVGALLTKNIMQFLRNPGGVLFGMLFPLVQVSAFFGAIGGDLKDLKISVVNDEAGNCNYGHYLGNVSYNPEEYECNFVDLSCRFLYGFNDTLIKKMYYDNLEDAKRAIIRDKTVGVMHFKRNFSLSQQSRINDGVSAPDEDINNSIINVYLDMGNREIGLFMQKKLPERFMEIYKEIMKECRVPEKIAQVPIRFENPIFGKKDATYDTFVAPAFLLTLNFFLATTLCSTTILTDRTAGVWERSLVQGVTTTQILITHIMAQAIIVIIQVIGTLGISMLAFGLECKGSMIIVGGLFLLNGLDGMLYGLLISIFSSSHSLANYAASGTFFPMLILCGIVWPIEGIPKIIRWLSVSTPLALPGTSLRSITQKASPITNSEVYTGFLVIIGWIMFFAIMCYIGLKKKK